jgi:hypothetical protein
MSEFGIDVISDFVSQYITLSSPYQYGLIKVVLAVTVVLGSFQFGRMYGQAGAKAKAKGIFIAGIMHHMNIVTYDSAKIPNKYDAEKDEYLVAAQKLLEKKIKPKLP